jgi:hypothetical protein
MTKPGQPVLANGSQTWDPAPPAHGGGDSFNARMSGRSARHWWGFGCAHAFAAIGARLVGCSPLRHAMAASIFSRAVGQLVQLYMAAFLLWVKRQLITA